MNDALTFVALDNMDEANRKDWMQESRIKKLSGLPGAERMARSMVFYITANMDPRLPPPDSSSELSTCGGWALSCWLVVPRSSVSRDCSAARETKPT